MSERHIWARSEIGSVQSEYQHLFTHTPQKLVDFVGIVFLDVCVVGRVVEIW